MGALVSAGSYAAAVMELAGYRAQADFLESFRDFFTEAGALIYVLAGVGAVISIVNFGSARAVRYLLIGPAIFWFLVTPTYRFDGVIWKIGAGTARGLHRVDGEGPSREDINRALKDAFDYPGQDVDVAYGFALFVRVINTLVNEINGVILKGEEDTAYRTFLHKGRAFDAVINSRPRNPLLVEVIDDLLLNKCSRYVGYAMALGSPELTDAAIENLGTLGNPARTAAEQRRNDYRAEFNRAKEFRANLDDRSRNILNLNGGLAGALSALGGVSPAGGIPGLLGPGPAINFSVPQTISCDDAWKGLAARLQLEANREALHSLGLARHDGAPQPVACNMLMKKLTGEDDPRTALVAFGGTFAGVGPTIAAAAGQQCLQKLKYISALFMTKNLFTDRQALPRFAAALLNPASGSNTNGGARMPHGWRLGASYGEVSGLTGNAYATLRALDPYDVSVEDLAHGARQNSLGTRLTVLGGANLATEASFVDFPRYDTRKLVQQLFSWSLNAPWWQGVLLYLLAIIYPFLALVVLIPGRAQSFLHLPLAWLWVKSWDIGFAMVMVLERVLWNNLPPIRFAEDVVRPLQENELQRALSEASKTEPIWNVHGYYMVTASALLAVPAVCGFVTLKSRRAILSSFTEKLLRDVKDRGDAAAGMVQIQAAAGRAQLMHELQNQAVRAMREDPNLEASRAVASATFALSGYAQAYAESVGRGENAAANQLHGLGGYYRAATQMMERFEAADRAYAIQFHPIYGRFGLLGISYDAEKAGADASGGFEMEGTYQADNAAVDALVDLHVARVQNMFTLGTSAGSAAVQHSRGGLALAAGMTGLFGDNLLGLFPALAGGRPDPNSPINQAALQLRMRLEELERRRVVQQLEAERAGLNPVTDAARIAAINAELARWRNVGQSLMLNTTLRVGELQRQIEQLQRDLTGIADTPANRPRRNNINAQIAALEANRTQLNTSLNPGVAGSEFSQRAALMAVPLATLNEQIENLRRAVAGHETGLAAGMGSYQQIMNSPAMGYITEGAARMFGTNSMSMLEQGYIANRGWVRNGVPIPRAELTDEQREELDDYMRPLREQFAVGAGALSAPVLANRIFGITPQAISQLQYDVQHGTHNQMNPANLMGVLDPYNANTFDFYGVPHFVDRPRPVGSPMFPIETTAGVQPPAPTYGGPVVDPTMQRWRLQGGGP